MKVEMIKIKPKFLRKKLEKTIIFLRKSKTLTAIMLFIFNFRIRRPMISYIKKNHEGSLVGMEIGTFEGENAFNILKHLPIERLYCVDPYSKYEGYSCKAWNDDCFEKAKKRLNQFGDKVIFIKKMSEYAVDNIPENLDFIYIDGNHSYTYVKRDIDLFYPKLKKGGIIGGHDIWSADVQKAVTEFAEQNGLNVQINYPDWWFL